MNAPATLLHTTTFSSPHIGEAWPGQGGVFAGIIGGKPGEPLRALIIATDLAGHPEKEEFGTYGEKVEGADSKDNGMANTIAFAAAGSDICKKILALDIEGHRDWFMPSTNESKILSINVPHLLNPEGWYWTSTQHDAYNVYVQDFEFGGSRFSSKAYKRRAVAVRTIQLSASVL